MACAAAPAWRIPAEAPRSLAPLLLPACWLRALLVIVSGKTKSEDSVGLLSLARQLQERAPRPVGGVR